MELPIRLLGIAIILAMTCCEDEGHERRFCSIVERAQDEAGSLRVSFWKTRDLS